ncbi:hypothetical protein [Streptomyces sp. NBC_00347]|uniref:hypothetical protein n=1 Tax=Streptomyces sp. NBC_00347 TaxID=2975721 RepID=UPI002259FFCD|nr:hypothetical protein [Streptomyces sp. NBC_00347]MCX5124555.1 hypothetical protein [Streptomyces sp. NBC_00347]
MNNRINAALCTATVLGLGAAALAVPTTAAQAATAFKPLQFSARVVHERVILDFGKAVPPKDLKVHLRKKGTTARVATIKHFTAVPENGIEPCPDGCGDPVVYAVPIHTDPLKLAAFGEYTVDVEYDGPQGENVSHKDKTSLNYQVRPSFTNLKASKEVTLSDPETVISGDIKLYDPRNGALKPYPGTFTARTGTVATPVAPDAKGHFTSKIRISGAETGSLPFDPATKPFDTHSPFIHLTGEANGVKEQEALRVGVLQGEASRVTLDSPTLTGPFGTDGKIGGIVTWKAPDGTWKPVPAGLRVAVNTAPSTVKYMLTDGTGRFQGSFPLPLDDDEPWQVRTDSPWVAEEGQKLPVDTTAGTSFGTFTAEYLAYKAVRVSAKLNLVEIPSNAPSWVSVDFQHSADGKTGWSTFDTTTVRTEPGGTTTGSIDRDLRYPGPGFVRVQYAGTPDIPGSATPAVRLIDRKATAISGFNAAPEPVKRGQPITVTGKLTEADAGRAPLAGVTVRYYFKATGDHSWTGMGTTKTAADGSFSRKFTASTTGTWNARYLATDTAYLYASSRHDEVVVTP